MKEIWKDIPNYEGLYQVSNMGRVKSLIGKEKILKPRKNNRGYLIVDLYKDKKSKHFLVHRLVALVFISNPNNYPVINHKDENPRNNFVDNLEWCTVEYNNSYGTRIKKVASKHRKPVIQYDENMNYIEEFKSIRDVKISLGIDTSHISACCKGKLKSAGGFIWRYKSE